MSSLCPHCSQYPKYTRQDIINLKIALNSMYGKLNSGGSSMYPTVVYWDVEAVFDNLDDDSYLFPTICCGDSYQGSLPCA